MSKVAIITDSNSGISQVEAESRGIFVVPMPFIVNDETLFEDINLTKEQFFEKLKEDADISTTQPSPEFVMNLWNDVFEEYNSIQKQQGFDLEDYKGKDVTIYTYEVYNYEGKPENMVANLMIYENRLIGGDLSCTELGGFIQGLMPIPEG